MEIILVKDVDNLGYNGDIVDVKPGYARNFLFPKRLAIVANPSNRKMIAENQKQAAHKIAQLREEAEKLAAKMEAVTLSIPTKVGTSGKIFGSVTSIQIASALKKEGFDIDRKKIKLIEDVKHIGNYEAMVRLHKEVEAKIPFEVVSEDGEKKKTGESEEA